jgi:hypothetical protein
MPGATSTAEGIPRVFPANRAAGLAGFGCDTRAAQERRASFALRHSPADLKVCPGSRLASVRHPKPRMQFGVFML